MARPSDTERLRELEIRIATIVGNGRPLYAGETDERDRLRAQTGLMYDPCALRNPWRPYTHA